MKNNKGIVIFTAAVMMLGGCEKSNQDSVTDELPPETESAAVSETTEEATEMTFPEIEETVSLSGEYVFDDAKVLSEKEKAEIYNEVLYITNTFKINCAVVTVSELKGRSASEYAEEYYKKLYSGSNGIMFLINNDTGNDYILRKGAPAKFIDNSDIEMIFAEISPMLVTENYSEAVKCVLGGFAERLPRYAVDRTNKLEKEEITAINDILAEASNEGESLSVIFIGDIGDKTITDYTKAQYTKYSALSSGSTAIIAVNTETGEYYIRGNGSFADAEKNQKSLKSGISGCLNDSGGKKTFDCRKAAELFVKFVNKADQT